MMAERHAARKVLEALTPFFRAAEMDAERKGAEEMRAQCAAILKKAELSENARQYGASLNEYMTAVEMEAAFHRLHQLIYDLPLPGEHTDE